MENQNSLLSCKRRTGRTHPHPLLGGELEGWVNEATGEIVTAVATTNDVSDDQVFCDLLDGVEGDISQVSGDGAYDIAAALAPPTTQVL